MTRVAGSATRRALRRWFVAAVIAAAVLLPPALAISALLLHYIGETWWLTSVGLYLPRFMLATPLVLLAPILLALKKYKLLLAQTVSLWLLLFPLLGFVLPSWHGSDDRGSLRLLSYNVNSVAAGPEAVAHSIAAFNPDVVLLQEVLSGADEMKAELAKVYPTVQSNGQFMIASRLPIRSTTTPTGFLYEGESHTAHFIRHELTSPMGPLVVYNVHPVSPRKTIATVRGSGIRKEVVSGRFFQGGSAATNKRNSDLRELELASAAELARAETLPTIIAGDTNLPALSPVLSRLFGQYQDSFEEAGWGFGYTYPRRLPWMRIDRIFGSHDLEFIRFEVGCGRTSDHLCVAADVRSAR